MLAALWISLRVSSYGVPRLTLILIYYDDATGYLIYNSCSSGYLRFDQQSVYIPAPGTFADFGRYGTQVKFLLLPSSL